MNNGGEQSRELAAGAYAVVRFSLGSLLLVAALLKAYQLATEPTAETSLLTSRWFLVGAVEFEILLGIALLAGVYARWVWGLTLGCFALFACVSLHKALSGEASCGCFGSVEVNPWHTFGLDAAATVALLRWRPVQSEAASPAGAGRRVARCAAVLGVWLLVGLPAAWTMTRFEAAGVSDAGDFIGDGEIVVLEPETWVGRPFPLIPHIDIGSRLADGQWIVLLYHHDCPQCLEVLPHYESRARTEVDASRPSVALVEVPPFRTPDKAASVAPVQRGRLRESREWFVQTPTEIRLNHGTVTRVRSAESLERAFRNGAVAGLPTEPLGLTAGLPRVSETFGRDDGGVRDPRRAFGNALSRRRDGAAHRGPRHRTEPIPVAWRTNTGL